MENLLVMIGILLIFLGFFAVITGILLQMMEQPKGREGPEVRGGAVIFIGPIPIAFGTDKESVIVVSVFMIVLMLVAWLLLSGWR
ncbi:MAG TPA: DUF131 domain-containing protein [Candidatus Altiarchaeales archaeon]|nr:DUF131 domain-containing protein [Candidatus Altiarchaeales archaeon]